MLVPRSKFGSSVYNVPLLLALRFFYHASPFETITNTGQQINHGRYDRNVARFTSQEITSSFTPVTSFDPPNHHTGTTPFDTTYTTTSPQSRLSSTPEKLTTSSWLHRLTNSASTHHHRLSSLTWVKALGSPLSHEFIQFILHDPITGHKSRHLTHRHVDGGDTVLLNFDWTRGTEPSQHHQLPLPLLSLTFNDDNAPTILEFAQVLASITARRPSYSLLREMCWWHSEAVFESCHTGFGGEVKAWEFAHLRYSFVVRTDFIKREKLVRRAEEFRGMNRSGEMRY